MQKPVPCRRDTAMSSDESRALLLAAGGLRTVMTKLHRRVALVGARRVMAQVLLVEAHIDEAIGLLRTSAPKAKVQTHATGCHRAKRRNLSTG
jgi:hypothetical protein